MSFYKYPYTDQHEINLDWFLGQFKNLKKLVEDLKKIVINAPDATTATAGQAPIADGAGGWAWGDMETGDSVPTNVRQAIFNLLNNAVYRNTDLQNEKAIIQSWASEVTSISVSPATLSMNGAEAEQLVVITQPAGGLVTWESSDTSVAEVDGGLVTSIGNGTCTITATSGSMSATCTVTVSGFATLTSISAVYTQSGTVYDTDTLDSLKSDLVVTASYDDSTTATVTDYTLSGTLTEGTSVITVTYGGKSDTFSVVVSPPVYPMTNGTHTFTGANYTGRSITISNGNHVAFVDENPSSTDKVYNNSLICDLVADNGTRAYTDFTKPTSVRFTLPANADVTLTLSNIVIDDVESSVLATKCAFALRNGATSVVTSGDFYPTDTSKTVNVTITDATDINYIFLYATHNIGRIEFDVCLTVNGERWI